MRRWLRLVTRALRRVGGPVPVVVMMVMVTLAWGTLPVHQFVASVRAGFTTTRTVAPAGVLMVMVMVAAHAVVIRRRKRRLLLLL